MDREYLEKVIGSMVVDISILKQQITERDKVIDALQKQVEKLTKPKEKDEPAAT